MTSRDILPGTTFMIDNDDDDDEYDDDGDDDDPSWHHLYGR